MIGRSTINKIAATRKYDDCRIRPVYIVAARRVTSKAVKEYLWYCRLMMAENHSNGVDRNRNSHRSYTLIGFCIC